MGGTPKLCTERIAYSMDATFLHLTTHRRCLFLILTGVSAVRDMHCCHKAEPRLRRSLKLAFRCYPHGSSDHDFFPSMLNYL